jgi:hypothetical protein
MDEIGKDQNSKRQNTSQENKSEAVFKFIKDILQKIRHRDTSL